MLYTHEEVAVAAYYIWLKTWNTDEVANWYAAEKDLDNPVHPVEPIEHDHGHHHPGWF